VYIKTTDESTIISFSAVSDIKSSVDKSFCEVFEILELVNFLFFGAISGKIRLGEDLNASIDAIRQYTCSPF